MLHTSLKNVASVLCNLNPHASGLKAGINVNKAYKQIIQLSTLHLKLSVAQSNATLNAKQAEQV